MSKKSIKPIKFEGSSFNEVWIKSIKTEAEFVAHPSNQELWDESSRANKLKELYKVVHGRKKEPIEPEADEKAEN